MSDYKALQKYIDRTDDKTHLYELVPHLKISIPQTEPYYVKMTGMSHRIVQKNQSALQALDPAFSNFKKIPPNVSSSRVLPTQGSFAPQTTYNMTDKIRVNLQSNAYGQFVGEGSHVYEIFKTVPTPDVLNTKLDNNIIAMSFSELFARIHYLETTNTYIDNLSIYIMRQYIDLLNDKNINTTLLQNYNELCEDYDILLKKYDDLRNELTNNDQRPTKKRKL